mmetsp:Transcript_46167/g.100072  ORF Transcript_46167/g.100072 Transcript_46167/m.100072 type:complete len:204 (+) Transcript_46167:166-777(+)
MPSTSSARSCWNSATISASSIVYVSWLTSTPKPCLTSCCMRARTLDPCTPTDTVRHSTRHVARSTLPLSASPRERCMLMTATVVALSSAPVTATEGPTTFLRRYCRVEASWLLAGDNDDRVTGSPHDVARGTRGSVERGREGERRVGWGCVARPVVHEPTRLSHVIGPTTPSAERPLADWKARMALSVPVPNPPSTATLRDEC